MFPADEIVGTHPHSLSPGRLTPEETPRRAAALQAQADALNPYPNRAALGGLEHIVEAGLAQALSCRNIKQAKRLLIIAVVVSRQHFDGEERVIFPLAERWLKTKPLQTLGAEWIAELKQVLG